MTTTQNESAGVGTTVLVIGATGSIGSLVVRRLLEDGIRVRAFTRSAARAKRSLPSSVEVFQGDFSDMDALTAATDGIDSIVLTQGGTARSSHYIAVRNLLGAINGRTPRIVYMTSMAVTLRSGRSAEEADWKRRAERLVRAYGAPYAIVRPGWFDYQGQGEDAVVLEQGDRSPVQSGRGVARWQIAEAIVRALVATSAEGKTFEIFAKPGEAPADWDGLFAALHPDDPVGLAGALDEGVGLFAEPAEVLTDIEALRSR